MSIVNCSISAIGPPQAATPPAATVRPLHRLAVLRRRQGLSRRTIARRLNLDIEQVRRQEEETADLPLSVLYAWQKALDVPIAELLTEADYSLSSPILERSQLVRLMKTVLAIQRQTRQESVRRMTATMIAQLVEIMPELAQVSPWHAVGKRRRLSELGMAALRRMSDDVFIDRG
jgi:transcriptional regulator with XRE-family HTH domain